MSSAKTDMDYRLRHLANTIDGQADGELIERAADRIRLLEGLLKEITPGVRDILWCALVWNDHNFDYDSLLKKATSAAKSMGLNRTNGVESVNAWMARVDAALTHSADGNGR